VDGVRLPPLQKIAAQALVRRLRTMRGDVLDARGRVQELADVLIPGIPGDALAAAREDIERGDGAELKERGSLPPKLHSAYSSAGLALNTFARWRLRPGSLSIDTADGFSELRFEVKLPIFDRPFGAPNLDVLLRRNGCCTHAIESKLTEYLQSKNAHFSERYTAACAQLGHGSWRVCYDALRAKPTRFSFLDAAQLLKHYLGMKRELSSGRAGIAPATLLYLYWEPSDADSWPYFAAHRAEIAAFGADPDDPEVRFRALSYRELWSSWLDTGDAQLRGHVDALRARYDVRLDADA
jgi:hypothetical protein